MTRAVGMTIDASATTQNTIPTEEPSTTRTIGETVDATTNYKVKEVIGVQVLLICFSGHLKS